MMDLLPLLHFVCKIVFHCFDCRRGGGGDFTSLWIPQNRVSIFPPPQAPPLKQSFDSFRWLQLKINKQWFPTGFSKSFSANEPKNLIASHHHTHSKQHISSFEKKTKNYMTDITITLHDPQSGASESMPMASTVSLHDVLEFSKALLGVDGHDLILTKDGKPLLPLSQTLAQAGVSNGDLLVILQQRRHLLSSMASQVPATAPTASTTTIASGGGGLDFSNLLGGGNSNSVSGQQRSILSNNIDDNPTPIYYAGMNLHEAMNANKHPKAFIQLLQTHQHLFKELNYHSPMLAMKLQNQSYEQAVQIWREELVKGSIQGATAISEAFHKENTMQARLQVNPNDVEAKLYFEQKQNRQFVQEQYRHCMEEYPESMGRVLMLYIEVTINHHPLQAFVDSGAQMTIMGKKCAQRCGILHFLDSRFAGVAVGVGTGKILGT
jgi:hypothetical protein